MNMTPERTLYPHAFPPFFSHKPTRPQARLPLATAGHGEAPAHARDCARGQDWARGQAAVPSREPAIPVPGRVGPPH